MANQTSDLQKVNPKERLNIILDDLDFSFYKREIETVIELYNNGFTILDIARIIKPYDIKKGRDEILLLIIHLLRQKTIKPRKEGIFEI